MLPSSANPQTTRKSVRPSVRMSFFRHWLVRAVVASTLLTLILGVARRLDPAGRGLQAQYFSNTAWTPPPAASMLDTQPSTNHLFEKWRGSPAETFSVSWIGWISAVREGTYTFATVSDGAVSVFVDGRLIEDNLGDRTTPLRSEPIRSRWSASADTPGKKSSSAATIPTRCPRLITSAASAAILAVTLGPGPSYNVNAARGE